MHRLLRERADHTAKERGMSLVELMVTMVITGLIAAMTAALVIGVQKTNHQNGVRQDQIETARVAVERLSKTLRSAVRPNQIVVCPGGSTAVACNQAFLTGGALEVSFNANLDNPGNIIGPSRVSYEVAGGELIETVKRPTSNIPTSAGYSYCLTGPGCAATTTTRVVARNVVSTAGGIFTFYDETGAEMPPSGTGALAASQLDKAVSVEIVLRVQNGTGPTARPTTYIQRILLPNAQALMKTGTT